MKLMRYYANKESLRLFLGYIPKVAIMANAMVYQLGSSMCCYGKQQKWPEV